MPGRKLSPDRQISSDIGSDQIRQQVQSGKLEGLFKLKLVAKASLPVGHAINHDCIPPREVSRWEYQNVSRSEGIGKFSDGAIGGSLNTLPRCGKTETIALDERDKFKGLGSRATSRY